MAFACREAVEGQRAAGPVAEGGVLAAGVADDPGDFIGGVEFTDFLVEGVDGGLEAEVIEGGDTGRFGGGIGRERQRGLGWQGFAFGGHGKRVCECSVRGFQ